MIYNRICNEAVIRKILSSGFFSGEIYVRRNQRSGSDWCGCIMAYSHHAN